jgi:choline monooxygenase
MCVESYAPDGAAGTQVNYAFYFAEGTSADEREATIASSDQILEEDRIICEAVQRNMSSGLYDGGVLSPRHENGVAYFQSLVLESLARSGG